MHRYVQYFLTLRMKTRDAEQCELLYESNEIKTRRTALLHAQGSKMSVLLYIKAKNKKKNIISIELLLFLNKSYKY